MPKYMKMANRVPAKSHGRNRGRKKSGKVEGAKMPRVKPYAKGH